MQIDILSFKYQANLTYFDKKNIVHIEIQTLKPALIADIARLADVGTATVDRVLNGPASVCPATCQRVLQAKAATENRGLPALAMLVSVKSTYCIAPSYRHNTYLCRENNQGNSVIQRQHSLVTLF
mgnify:CR=1 FL=1